MERASGARLAGMIDFDPASCLCGQQDSDWRRYYLTANRTTRSGAMYAWRGPAVFINPPYDGGTIRRFAERLLIELHTGVVDRAIWVSNANTGAVAGQMISEGGQRRLFPARPPGVH